jgi:protein O-GlcNAc transferase
MSTERTNGLSTYAIIASMNGPVVAAFIGSIYAAGALPGQTGSAADANQHAETGVQYAREGNLVRAEAELRRAVDLAPNNPSYLTSLGGILGMQEKLAEANVYFERAVKLDPTDRAARRNLAANDWRLGRLQQAQANLERLLQDQPQDKVAMLLLGMVSENEHQYVRAAKLLSAVPDLVEQRPESVAALASSYYHTSRRDDAHKTLEALLARSAPPQGIFAAAGVAAEAEDYGIAEKLFESIRSSYPDTTALAYNLALIQFRTGQIAKCRETLVQQTNAGRATAEIYNLLVTVLVRSNKLATALQTSRKAVEAFPQSDSAYISMGGVEMKMDQFTDAVKSYRRALELNPKSLDGKIGMASAEWAAGMRTDAELKFKELLKQHPREASVYENYGKSLRDGATDDAMLARAGELLKRAVELDNSSQPEPHFELGLFELKKNTVEASAHAAEQLEAAAHLGLNDSKLHYALARAYRRLGRDDDAAKEMRLYEETVQIK